MLCLSVCVAPALWADQADISLQRQTVELDLSRALLYRADPEHQLDIAAAMQALQQGEYQGGQTQAFNFGFTDSAYWFYVHIRNESSPEQQWIIESQYPILDQLDVYYRYADGREMHQQAGDTVAFAARSKAHHTINFALNLAQGEQVEVFIRVQTTGAVQMPLKIWTEDAFADRISAEQMAFGLYYGMLLALLLYNLLLFVVIRDVNYLLYVLYIASYGLFQFSLNGLSFQYLWPESPQWNNHSIAFLIGTGLLFITLFSRSFLSLKQNSPALDRVLIGFMVFFVGIAIFTFVVPYKHAIRTATLGALLAAITIMISAVVCWLKQYRPARYFLLSWIALLTGMVAYTLKSFSLLPSNFVTEYAIQFGSALEMILLSLALADRIKILQEENQRMQIQVQEKLEQHVQERTLELERANRKLEELSTTDALTGLKNRRYFNEAFALECKRASRNGDSLSVILIDIDHFKNINDSYGHLLGDECIKAIAAAIQQAAYRQTDTKCRYGGEEFVVLMPSTPADGALQVAANIQTAIRALAIPWQDKTLALTASLGVATVVSEREDAMQDVLAQADQALYQAKASGRNATVAFSRSFSAAQFKSG